VTDESGGLETLFDALLLFIANTEIGIAFIKIAIRTKQHNIFVIAILLGIFILTFPAVILSELGDILNA
jgi:hypothetical protein